MRPAQRVWRASVRRLILVAVRPESVSAAIFLGWSATLAKHTMAPEGSWRLLADRTLELDRVHRHLSTTVAAGTHATKVLYTRNVVQSGRGCRSAASVIRWRLKCLIAGEATQRSRVQLLCPQRLSCLRAEKPLEPVGLGVSCVFRALFGLSVGRSSEKCVPCVLRGLFRWLIPANLR